MGEKIMRSREEVIKIASSWLGKKESDGSYKEIIDIYNSFKGPFPRGLKMQYDWSWCACTWSAIAIKLGYTDIMPIEISCGELINGAKKMGCWQENDAYIPLTGDAILYDWDDSGKGDNTGWPDHVGIVEYVSVKSGYITVIEGNYQDSVKKRTISINGKYIRGFITPKYDGDWIELPYGEAGEKDVKTLALEVISGLWGDGEKRELMLETYGYNYSEVQAKVNEILNTPSKNISASKTVVTSCYAKSKDYSLSGTYVTIDDLYCRNDAGTNKKALCLIPKGTEVENFGFYTMFGDVPWLLIQFYLDGIEYIGFSSSKYLKKKK